mmetsp:Transcript_54477/g.124512  ORF Transcript_54477/g.124512 Transcript_54477/m.124512 type:complete len:394 (+) Transcript_54477:62-1243(+)
MSQFDFTLDLDEMADETRHVLAQDDLAQALAEKEFTKMADECQDLITQALLLEEDRGREEMLLLLGDDDSGDGDDVAGDVSPEDEGLGGLPMLTGAAGPRILDSLLQVVTTDTRRYDLDVKRSAEFQETSPTLLDDLHVAKRKRDEFEAATPEDYAAPLTGGLVDRHVKRQRLFALVNFWADSTIAKIGVVSDEDVQACKLFLLHFFGETSGSSAPRPGPTLKVVLMDRLLLALCHIPCQDARLKDEPLRAVVEPELQAGEAGGVTRFLKPGRNFRVNDPLAFNTAFRYLQASDLWPSKGMNRDAGTKGMTQVLDALGVGPVEKSGRWTGKNLGVRGPEDTDPSKEWRDGKWATKKGDRDSLYFRQYVFDLSRVAKATNAAHIFKNVPSKIKC